MDLLVVWITRWDVCTLDIVGYLQTIIWFWEYPCVLTSSLTFLDHTRLHTYIHTINICTAQHYYNREARFADKFSYMNKIYQQSEVHPKRSKFILSQVNLFFPWCNQHRQPNDTKQNQHNLILVNSWTPISSLTLHGMTGKVKFINVECRIWVELYRLTKEVKKAKKQLSSFKLLKLKDCHCNQSSSKGRASLLHACFRPNWEV